MKHQTNKILSEHVKGDASMHIILRFISLSFFLLFLLTQISYAATASEIGRDGRFIAYSDGTVLDTQTNLMWAAKDNGADINWSRAKSYCKNYRGGGYTDWRMPTQDELAGLFDRNKSRPAACRTSVSIHVATELIDITCFTPWASETRGSEAAYFGFGSGLRNWYRPSYADSYRALPVRASK